MENHGNRIKRREFLKSTGKFAAAIMFMSLGSSKLFGALISTLTRNLIPTVTLTCPH